MAYHEFAHKLDMLDGCVDGTPPLAEHAQYERWVEICTREYDALRRRASKGKRTFLNAYGGTNTGELFAIITEYFFDKPLQMIRHRPELYALLQGFYRQDPAAHEARHFARAPGFGPRGSLSMVGVPR